MTDIPGSYSKIQTEEVRAKSAASEYTMTKIGAAINSIIEGGAHPLGTVLSSILTTAQFQAIMGTNWIRIGETSTSISGTDLETLTGISSIAACPAGYGLGNGANTSLSTASVGANISHSHTTSSTIHVYTGTGTSKSGITSSGWGTVAGEEYTSIVTTSSASSGGTANLPAIIKVNFFIKVNVDA